VRILFGLYQDVGGGPIWDTWQAASIAPALSLRQTPPVALMAMAFPPPTNK
jgi:hypothetical protein